MKWIPKEEIALGAVREIKRFAWLPTRTDDGFIVWLERYMSQEKYVRRTEYLDSGEFPVSWDRWEVTSKKILVTYL